MVPPFRAFLHTQFTLTIPFITYGGGDVLFQRYSTPQDYDPQTPPNLDF